MSGHGDLDAMQPQLAELAMYSPDQRTFRQAWLSLLSRTFSVDSADVISSSDGITFVNHSFNADPVPAHRIASHMAEMSTAELALLTRGRALLDDQVFSVRRREQLLAYRELLNPRGVVSNAVRSWTAHGSLFFVCLCKHRGTRAFRVDDLSAIDRLIPIIAIGEALFAERDNGRTKRSIAELGVSEAEAKVVSLAQRGLTNQEISAITGTRPPTVRNQLSAAYRKLGVSNRTELSFVLAEVDCTFAQAKSVPSNAIGRLLEKERELLRSSISKRSS